MNILIFSWRGPNHPHAGGAEVATYNHATNWVKHGHSVTLFTSHFPGAKEEEYNQGLHIIRQGSEVIGVRVRAILWYVFSKHKEYDIVIDEFHGLPFFTPLFVKKKKLAFIHEVAKEVWKFNVWPKPFNLLPKFIGVVGEPFIFKIFYKQIKFITVSASTKKDLITWSIPQNNITVIHNGLTISTPKLLPKKEMLLTFLGALAKDKGIEDAIKCFGRIAKHDEKWRFLIIGKGDRDYLQYLKKLVKKEHIEKKVKFLGYVDEKTKVSFLAKSYLLLNPSVWEGWGLTVIEAAALHTPTVGYNVPGLRDSILDKKTGILTKTNTPEEMAKQVIYLKAHTTLYDGLQKQGKKWASSLTWDVATGKSLLVLETLYKEKKR